MSVTLESIGDSPLNIPSGTLLTILWDSDGSHYHGSNISAGLSVFSNGTLIHSQKTLSAVNVTLPFNLTSATSYRASQPRYNNILANPNSPWGLPHVTADYILSLNGDFSAFEAWKMNDGLLWYDFTPDNRWTNNQSHIPYDSVDITLNRARNFSSVSIAIYDDSAHGGVIKCPEAISISTNGGTVLAERNPWTGCVPNALNTIVFDAAGASNDSAGTIAGMSYGNQTGSGTGTLVETDNLHIVFTNQRMFAVAVPEIQIWVPPNEGPRYEAEDGLLGTFVGGFEGKALGLNCTIQGGGVVLGEGGWADIAGVKSLVGTGTGTLDIIGGGTGTLAVRMNWLDSNVTVAFDGNATKSIDVDFLQGDNYVTLIQVDGSPWVDAIVVGGAGPTNSTV